jgi:hypothetical protein
MRLAVVRSHADPTSKRRRSEAIRTAMSTDEFKARRSAASRMAWYKSMETNVRTGSVRESRGEREFVTWLRSEFGNDDVVHHPARVNGWDLDVYVRSIDTYVQFDGIYYHGLDRPYDDLSPVIRRKYDRDKAADAYFMRVGQRLVRITDREWAAMSTPQSRSEWLYKVLRQELPSDCGQGRR